MYDVLFCDALVVDGSGREPYRANVATVSSSIALIGKERPRARRVVDCHGRALMPGFIDIHAHDETYALGDGHMALKRAQGITSSLSGNCGIGVFPLVDDGSSLSALADDVLGHISRPWPWKDFTGYVDVLKRHGMGINMGFLQAHSPLRHAVMGSDVDRTASPEEVEAMCRLLDSSLSCGAFGFSTGLYYRPCISAGRDELRALLSVVSKHDALFSVHLRSEGDQVLEALEEVLSLSLETGARLELSHFKVIGSRNQDKVPRALELVHSYKDRGLDVAFDQYPYDYGSTSLFSLLPPWMLTLSRTELRFALQLDSERSEAKKEILDPDGWESIYALEGPGEIRILHLDSRDDLDGLSLEELGERSSSDPLDALFDVLSEERGAAVMSDVTQSRESLEAIMADDLMCFSTDALYSSIPGHERSHSAAIELLSNYSLKRGVLTLPDCVRRMSGEPARRLGLKERGILREGAQADLVLLDLDTLSSVWTDGRNPGVDLVLVNGQVVLEEGRVLDVNPGALLLPSRQGSC